VAELDGVWEVKRRAARLPPPAWRCSGDLRSVGGTKAGTLPGVPFDVVGLSLRYRAPFVGFVDVLERDGQGYRGLATFRGRSSASSS